MKLADLFYFTKSDRTVMLWLILLIASIIGLFYFADKQSPPDQWTLAMDSTQRNGDSGYYSQYNKDARNSLPSPGNKRRMPLHPFDLNTATPDELLDLGFTKREVYSVMRYRSRGGIYRRVEQMSRISGMTKREYELYAPYFYVSDEFKLARDFVKDPASEYRNTAYNSRNTNTDYQGATTDSRHSENENGNFSTFQDSIRATYPKKIKAGETVPINSSDTTELKKIPGIGSAFANMIVRYRERLGGFYSIEQLNDLEAIPFETQQYLRLDPVPLRKLKVNHLSVNRLVGHPYINYYKAKAIVDYVRTKGQLKSLRELQLNKNFSEQDILRIEPYLDFSE